MSNIDALKNMLLENPYDSVCWGKLYKKEIFLNYKFNEQTQIAEDLEILYKIFWDSKCITYNPKAKYIWLKRGESVTNGKYSNKWMNEIRICEEIINFYSNNCIELYDYAVKRFVRVVMTCISKLIKGKSDLEEYKKLREYLYRYKKNVRKNVLFSKKEKIKFFLVIYFPNFFRILLNMKD